MDSRVSRPPFKIAIVGGGIGGLFCSLAIHHHCTEAGTSVNIDVYEQASQYREIGAGIGVGINAARLYHKLGIGQKLNAIAGNGKGVWITFRRFDTSEEILTLPSDDNAAIRQAPCARSELLDLLRETIESRRAATLHTKKTFKRVEDFGDRVRLHFADSSIAEANIVIGCDGIHSAVRSQFVVDDPIFSGQIAYRGVIPTNSIPSWPFKTYRVVWLAKHRHLLVSPITANNNLNIVAFVTKSEREVADVKESWTSTCERKDAIDDFADFDEPAQQVLRLLPEKPSKWKINDRLPLDQWHYMGGKVVMLGDAAHAMLPHLGAGAGQAVEDAWVLGRALQDFLAGAKNEHFASLEKTMQLYQDVRLPRAQKVQRTSRLAGDTYEFQAEDMKDKTLEECIPIMAERTRERMKWVWEEDLDAAYEKARR
ncbi:FAD binding domain [Teratosphaeria destructans]|uniref:FAD binding domain n=1 Tax=Teratosphaeria destructans TaxID=418781 RepID=A0A9W7SIQ3_9PEZI|nr:FAD binding domain [Teratosphaeria destructans]